MNRKGVHPKIDRGRVWCTVCGDTRKVSGPECMSSGWPKCCGYTMTIDSPEEREELQEARNAAIECEWEHGESFSRLCVGRLILGVVAFQSMSGKWFGGAEFEDPFTTSEEAMAAVEKYHGVKRIEETEG